MQLQLPSQKADREKRNGERRGRDTGGGAIHITETSDTKWGKARA